LVGGHSSAPATDAGFFNLKHHIRKARSKYGYVEVSFSEIFRAGDPVVGGTRSHSGGAS
jgi:hypothetical protein